MSKNFYFISGLPRSGSTLLANVLAQNPKFHISPTSGILDILFLVRNNWNKIVEFQANPNEQQKLQVLRGILQSYYSNVDAPIVFDRSRSWLAHLEMAEAITGKEAKILVPVRDVRDVLSSIEKLYRKTSGTSQIPHEEPQYLQFQDVAFRVNFWAQKDQLVGLAYTRIKDAIGRGHAKKMLFVPYEKLTSKPEVILEQIYSFLGEEQFKHNINNVSQVIHEDDRVHGFAGLHDIKPKIETQKMQWPEILGEEIAKPFADLNFWNK